MIFNYSLASELYSLRKFSAFMTLASVSLLTLHERLQKEDFITSEKAINNWSLKCEGFAKPTCKKTFKTPKVNPRFFNKWNKSFRIWEEYFKVIKMWFLLRNLEGFFNVCFQRKKNLHKSVCCVWIIPVAVIKCLKIYLFIKKYWWIWATFKLSQKWLLQTLDITHRVKQRKRERKGMTNDYSMTIQKKVKFICFGSQQQIELLNGLIRKRSNC